MVTCLGVFWSNKENEQVLFIISRREQKWEKIYRKIVCHRTILALPHVENGDLESTKYNLQGLFPIQLSGYKALLDATVV